MEAYEIQLGKFRAKYFLYETPAHKNYDGFGTITISGSDEGPRWVLIRDEHLNWQLARYSSGLRSATPVGELEDYTDYITEKLYRSITGAE